MRIFGIREMQGLFSEQVRALVFPVFFFTKTCVDITNPKVIRSTMGSVYRMPFLYVEDVVSLKAELEQKGIRTFAAHLEKERIPMIGRITKAAQHFLLEMKETG